MSKKSSHTNIDILLQCLSMTGPLRALLRGSTVLFTCFDFWEIENFFCGYCCVFYTVKRCFYKIFRAIEYRLNLSEIHEFYSFLINFIEKSKFA